jgi:hypothetical protein
LLLGILAAASGGLKLRGRVRRALGPSPVAGLEIVLGAAMVLGSAVGLARARALAWALVAATLAVVLASSIRHASRLAELRRRRAASEGVRLEQFLKAGRGST